VFIPIAYATIESLEQGLCVMFHIFVAWSHHQKDEFSEPTYAAFSTNHSRESVPEAIIGSASSVDDTKPSLDENIHIDHIVGTMIRFEVATFLKKDATRVGSILPFLNFWLHLFYSNIKRQIRLVNYV
jgi:hypothetical protein